MVNTVPILAVSIGMYYTGIEVPMFHTGLNTGRTGHVLAIPIDFRHYWPT